MAAMTLESIARDLRKAVQQLHFAPPVTCV